MLFWPLFKKEMLKNLWRLYKVNKQSSAVLRDGKVIEVDAEELVVGDVLVLELVQ